MPGNSAQFWSTVGLFNNQQEVVDDLNTLHAEYAP